jgi:hypothetical protein
MSFTLRTLANTSRNAARTTTPGAQRAFSYTPFGPNPKPSQSAKDSATLAETAAAAAEEGALTDAQAYVLTQPPSSTYFRNVPLGAYPVAVPYNNEDAQAAAHHSNAQSN